MRGYEAPDMRRLSLIAAAIAFALGACERHTWEDVDANQDGVIDQNERGTKRLFEKHGDAHAGKGKEADH